jgi:hypothetical protein
VTIIISGIGLMTPDQVTMGEADDVYAARWTTLDQAFRSMPEMGRPAALPTDRNAGS